MLPPPELFQHWAVQLIHRSKLSVAENSPVVEHAGERLGLCQRLHMNELRRNAVRRAEGPQLFNALGDEGTLVVVVNHRFLPVDGLLLRVGREAGHPAVKAQRQQLVAVLCPIYRRKAVFLGEVLIGELGQYRTIRWQRRRCLFRHLLLADFSIYLQ